MSERNTIKIKLQCYTPTKRQIELCIFYRLSSVNTDYSFFIKITSAAVKAIGVTKKLKKYTDYIIKYK